MKFVMIVLAIHLVVEMISNRNNGKIETDVEANAGNALHPAEFNLRP